MVDLSDIPDSVPAEALSGAAKALRSDNPDDVINGLEKGEVMTLLRHLTQVPDEFVGKTESNVSTQELRHIATHVINAESNGSGNGGD